MMKYWWVNQTDNWRDEFERSYLYAGRSEHVYRRSILDVRKDDLVICTHGAGAKRTIYTIGVIQDDPSGQLVQRRKTRIVQRRNKQAWPEGWEVSVQYTKLEHPVSWPPLRESLLQDGYEAKHFTENAPGVQGYLFPVSPATAGAILSAVNSQQPAATRFVVTEPTTIEQFATAVAAEIMVRVGHQRWAEEVKKMWGYRCCATGFSVKKLLRSSHIVAWAEDESCRLDPYNGLCLSPAYDAAFDAHLITFQSDGHIALAEGFSETSARQIGIDPNLLIHGLLPEHLPYLERHRHSPNSPR